MKVHVIVERWKTGGGLMADEPLEIWNDAMLAARRRDELQKEYENELYVDEFDVLGGEYV